ncbi:MULTISPECIES: SPL family radical SAM protein [Streptomyces]|uniref:SPL family radical SAM protein n=1 Tax=Streptomyces TaxID=1883 RepID=UPI000D47771D|nr:MULTISPECIES: radical SAM protein [Streptomyces]PPS70209.1 radical SAM protein [Streptomyces sp. 46]
MTLPPKSGPAAVPVIVVLNYTGCVLGCAYCFASFAGRQFGRSVKEWGDYLYVKKNAVELARKELAKMPQDKRRGTMLLSSVTEPYQGHETKYRLTRGILRELRTVEYPGLVRILTKSPVVNRDIDLLTSLPRAEVGMTVTTTDDNVSRRLEVRAPLASRRLRTLAELKEAGIPTYAFVGPLLPHFSTRPELLDDLFGQLVEAGIGEVFMEHINLERYIRERMDQVLADEPEDVREAYLQARTKEHREQLDTIVAELLDKHGLRLRFEEVVHHDDNDALRERLASSA